MKDRSFLPVISLAAAALTAALFVAGCASPSADDAAAPDEGAQEQDFTSKGGVTLTAAGDADLRISLIMLDGVKASTKNKRFVKATVFRKTKSFGAFCSISGDLQASDEVAKIGCSIGVATVSNDDDESLFFDIRLSRNASGESITLANVSYAGDGTFLGKEAAIVGHDGAAPLALVAKEASNVDRNALLFARTVLDATRPLLSKKVKSEEVDAPVAVKSASFMVDEKMNVSTSLRLGRTGSLSAQLDPVSVLKTAGDLSKGVLDKAQLTARLEAALPR